MRVQWTASQRQIANGIQYFVPHALIGPPQPVANRPIWPKYKQISRRYRQPAPVGSHPLGVFDGDKCSGLGQLVAICLGRHSQRQLLPADWPRPVIQHILDRQPWKGGRHCLDPRFAIANPHGLRDDKRFQGCTQILHAGSVNRFYKRLRRTIHTWQLFAIDPHHAAVDPNACQCAQEMLHHLYATSSHSEIGAAGCFNPILDRRCDSHWRIYIGPHEHHTGTGRRRLQFHPDSLAGPIAEAGDNRWSTERPLRPEALGVGHIYKGHSGGRSRDGRKTTIECGEVNQRLQRQRPIR